VARAEYDEVPDETVRRLRHALVGPLGSIGDKLIWAGVLPVAVALGLIITASVSPVVGAVTFLVLYNAVHLVVRTWALRAGWAEGKEVSRALNAAGLQRSLRVAGPAAAVAVGFAIPVLGAWLARAYTWQAQTGMALVAGLALVFSRWLLPTLGGLRYGLAAAAVALLLGWVW